MVPAYRLVWLLCVSWSTTLFNINIAFSDADAAVDATTAATAAAAGVAV